MCFIQADDDGPIKIGTGPRPLGEILAGLARELPHLAAAVRLRRRRRRRPAPRLAYRPSLN